MILVGAWVTSAVAQETVDAVGGDTSAAASQVNAPSRVEEIVVQARRRAELLEDTPVSVTAMSAKDLESAQVQNLDDLQSFVPNLAFRQGRTGADASIYIRGIGTQTEDIFLDQAVGLYVDGIFLSRAAGSVLDIVDIAQVEVLRGPQGTLFGKNTVGGAVSITTQKPEPELGGLIKVRAGNYDIIDTRAMLNVPVDIGWFEDRLALRLNASTKSTSGYTYNVIRDESWNDYKSMNFLGALRLHATDDITVDWSGGWFRNTSNGRGGECFFQQRSAFDGIPGDPPDEYYDYCRTDGETPFRFNTNLDGLVDIRSYGTWGTVQWDVGEVEALGIDDLTVKLISSWREQINRFREDIDMTEFALWRWAALNRGGEFNGDDGVSRQISLELQETVSALDGRLNFVSGVYFFWDRANTEFDIDVFPDGGQLAAISGASTKSQIGVDNFNWAIFGQATFDITDWASITAGLRYTNEEKSAQRQLSNLRLCESGDSPPCGPGDRLDVRAEIPDRSVKFDAWTPMVSLALTMPDEWLGETPIEHLMGYFTYSRGFKGGGINAPVQSNDPIERRDFAPEKLDSFEIGLKTIAFDRRLRASLSAFYGEYTNLQLPTVFLEPCPEDDPDCIQRALVITDNAGEATQKGIEYEMNLQPIDGLMIDASVSVLDAEYDDYPTQNVLDSDEIINRAGERLPFAPSFQSHIGIQYSHYVETGVAEWADGWVTPRLDWSYQGSVKNWGEELAGSVQRGYNLLNFRLGYRFNDEQTEVALWSRNLTDETYFDEVYQVQASVLGTTSRFYAWPRTFGAELSHAF